MISVTVHWYSHYTTPSGASSPQPPGADRPHTGHHADRPPQKTAGGSEGAIHQETAREVKCHSWS